MGIVTHSCYLRAVFDIHSARITVDEVHRTIIKNLAKEGEAIIAVCGNSGVGIGYPLMHKYGWPILVVRKPKESSHGYIMEGTRTEMKKYIILDDFFSTGSTVLHIISTLKDGCSDLKCIGAVFYWGTPEAKSFRDISRIPIPDEDNFPCYYTISENKL